MTRTMPDPPTRGGLRIGKDLPERGPRAPFDERLEWDRDGQYFPWGQNTHAAMRISARTGHRPLWRSHSP